MIIFYYQCVILFSLSNHGNKITGSRQTRNTRLAFKLVSCWQYGRKELRLVGRNRYTLRGLNFADYSIREIFIVSRGFNFADGPFRNILRISRMGLVQIFSKISRIDKALLETGGWNKTNKNQLRNNSDFYVWEISKGLRFV